MLLQQLTKLMLRYLDNRIYSHDRRISLFIEYAANDVEVVPSWLYRGHYKSLSRAKAGIS